MEASMMSALALGRSEDARQQALERCSALLEREGFKMSTAGGPPAGSGVRPPDLLVTNGRRFVRVFVLYNGDVDEIETEERIRAAHREGETRVYVAWPLRWRMLSNLDRWNIAGVAVASW